MTNFFHPGFHGEFRPDVLAPDLFDRLTERIQTGLFPLASARRNEYMVTYRTAETLRFQSTHMFTGINIGLNDVSLSLDASHPAVHFTVIYWTWAKYCCGLGVTLLMLFAFVFFGQPFFPAHWLPPEGIPGLFFWLMTIFFCVVWPWILVAFHKRSARKCLLNILDEVNEPTHQQEAA